ncbi:MAG: response regulator [Planctomycetota bacterium]|jgi:two-component system chemotaxis response regulator CheY
MSLNILLVDDSATVRAIIIKTLKLARVPINHTYEASNGKEGLDILAENWIDLIFADINMPVMNGVEMIEKMSEDGLLKTIPVIIVSSDGSRTRIETLKSKGVSAYIRKPFTPELIQSVVEDVLGFKGQDGKNEILAKLFSEILEKQAFMFAEVASKENLETGKDEHVIASMAFSGTTSGKLVLVVPRTMGNEIAANVLGLEPDDNTVVIKSTDALKEILSITCAHALTAIKGETSVFDMSPPQVDNLDTKEWKALLDEPDSVGFMVDGAPVLLQLSVGEERA